MATVTEKKRSSGEDSAKKRRKISLDLPENPASEDRENPFKRVFSEEDEIQLLNAFLDISKTANASPSPATAAALIFDRVRDSFTGEFTQTQLIEKLRKLRQKYSKHANNKLFIKNPHQRDVFEISHKIWGEDLEQQKNSTSSAAKDPGSVADKEKKNSKTLGHSPPTEDGGHAPPTEDGEAVVVAELALENFSYLMEEVSRLPCTTILREGLRCLDGSVLKRLNHQWRLQQIAEAKILAERFELIQEQTKLILDAVVSSLPN